MSEEYSKGFKEGYREGFVDGQIAEKKNVAILKYEEEKEKSKKCDTGMHG